MTIQNYWQLDTATQNTLKGGASVRFPHDYGMPETRRKRRRRRRLPYGAPLVPDPTADPEDDLIFNEGPEGLDFQRVDLTAEVTHV